MHVVWLIDIVGTSASMACSSVMYYTANCINYIREKLK